jgi:hypothetical protein
MPTTDGEVGLNILLPADLHRTAKTLAGARGITLRELVIRSLTAEIERGYHTERGRATTP